MGIDLLPANSDRYSICTSSTRPPAPVNGSMIYETDTDRLYVYDGSAWTYMTGGVDPISAKATRNAAFALVMSATVPTLIPFDTETYGWDNGNNFDVATGRYTCPENARYRIDSRISTTASAVGERYICAAYINTAEFLRGTDVNSQTTGRVTVEVHGTVNASAGDVIDVRVHQLSGTSRNIDVGANGILAYMEVSRAR